MLVLGPPNRVSKKPRCWGAAAAAARYCGPQLFWASAPITAWRCMSSSPPRRVRCRSARVRSILPRICWICPLSDPHCGAWVTKMENRVAGWQPSRWYCAWTRSRSACCLLERFVDATGLLGARGVGAGAIDGGELAFEPHADGVSGRPGRDGGCGSACAAAAAGSPNSARAIQAIAGSSLKSCQFRPHQAVRYASRFPLSRENVTKLRVGKHDPQRSSMPRQVSFAK